MDVSSSLLNAASGTNALKAAVGVTLLTGVKEIQTAQAATLLLDFANAQPAPHPHAGSRIDIRG